MLKWNNSLYGIKQAGANWYDLLNNGIERSSYHQYQVDPCVFYRKYSAILTYVDDFVIVSHIQEAITPFIASLNNGPENYVLTDEGGI